MSTDRKVLGKGLGALISGPAIKQPVNSGIPRQEVLMISVPKIQANPCQPRSEFSMEKLLELTDSIKNKGIIQPLIVRKSDDDGFFQIIAGERRFRAARLAGLSEVPAVVRQIDDEELLETALIENIQREDLNPLEEAISFHTLIENIGYTQDELAKRLGKSRTSITNSLRLLKLPDEIKDNISRAELTAGHARALLSVDTPKQMLEIRDQIIENDLSVRDTEKISKNYGTVEPEKAFNKQNTVVKPERIKESADTRREQIEFEHVTNELAKKLSAKVKISGNINTGKILLYYNGNNEFNRIYSLLKKIEN